MNKELIQLINIIQYRLEKSIRNADEKYFDFKPGKESRSPNEILSHLIDVGNYTFSMLDKPYSTNKESTLSTKVNENFLVLKSVLSKEVINDTMSKRLINGPLSDTLTHIGQLAYLRGLHGSPIGHENYSKADI